MTTMTTTMTIEQSQQLDFFFKIDKLKMLKYVLGLVRQQQWSFWLIYLVCIGQTITCLRPRWSCIVFVTNLILPLRLTKMRKPLSASSINCPSFSAIDPENKIKIINFLLTLPEPKVINLCPQYRARPNCTSVQSDQALSCSSSHLNIPKYNNGQYQKFKLDYFI